MRAYKCQNCGGPLPPRHSKWCLKHECVMAADRRYSATYHKHMKRVGASRRKMRQQVAFNPKPCAYCGKPLGKTVNRFFHVDCHSTVSSQQGIDIIVIRDSAGFVAQRVVAHIVNVGCDIVQQRIASPEDLDSAVMLGLNYPRGPLAMGDALGAANVLAVLEGIHACYAEPRYRPSPWLRRRARLGVSLLTPD